MLVPASRDSRSPATAFTVLVTLAAGLLVWLVLTSFGLARIQQQATARLQHEAAVLIAEELSAPTLDGDGRTPALRPALARLADSTGLAVAIDTVPAGTTITPDARALATRLAGSAPGAPTVRIRVQLSEADDSPSMAPIGPQVVLSLLFALLSLTLAVAAVMLLRFRREHALQRQRASFTSSVSHEMRTPLAQILLFGETLHLGRARTDADRALASGAIVQEARRLMRLVDNVLRLARLETAPARLRQDVVAVDALVRETARQFAPLAETSQVSLHVDAPHTVEALADADALRQVVLNLLDNAVKYGPPAQQVCTRVVHDRDAVRLIVEDEGPGIAPADRDRIWLPFERGGEGLTAHGGSGLGLTIVRELTEAMGGRVTCEAATAGGRGARFVVTLPTASTGTPRTGAPRTETPRAA